MPEVEPIARRRTLVQEQGEPVEYKWTGTDHVYIYKGRLTTCIGHSKLTSDGKSFVLEPEHSSSEDPEKGCLQRGTNSDIIIQ